MQSTDHGSRTATVYCGQCGNESECSTATATEVIVSYSLFYSVATAAVYIGH